MKNKHYRRRAYLLGLATLIVLFSLLLIYVITHREQSAYIVWNMTHSGKLASKIAPDNAPLLLAIGNYYFGNGSYDLLRARHYFSRAVNSDGALPVAHYQLGRTYFIDGNFAKAIQSIDAEITINPTYEKSYYMKGLIAGYQKDYPTAEYGFSTFISHATGSWAGYNDLAWIYFAQGKYEDMRDTAELGLSYDYGNAWLLNAAGLAAMNLGDYADALDLFTRAKTAFAKKTPEDWGRSYPGNDPIHYAEGYRQMQQTIVDNIALAERGIDGIVDVMKRNK